jgi:hypothetical protein
MSLCGWKKSWPGDKIALFLSRNRPSRHIPIEAARAICDLESCRLCERLGYQLFSLPGEIVLAGVGGAALDAAAASPALEVSVVR